MIITGLRGVGKTVLLNNFRRQAIASNWVVIEAEVTKHPDDVFRRNVAAWVRSALFELSPRARWTERLQKAGAVLRSFSISVDPTGSLSAGIDVDAWRLGGPRGLQHDLTDLLVAVGEAAQDRGRGVVLLFDEVQFMNSAQLEALISALHKAVQTRSADHHGGSGAPADRRARRRCQVVRRATLPIPCHHKSQRHRCAPSPRAASCGRGCRFRPCSAGPGRRGNWRLPVLLAGARLPRCGTGRGTHHHGGRRPKRHSSSTNQSSIPRSSGCGSIARRSCSACTWRAMAELGP